MMPRSIWEPPLPIRVFYSRNPLRATGGVAGQAKHLPVAQGDRLRLARALPVGPPDDATLTKHHREGVHQAVVATFKSRNALAFTTSEPTRRCMYKPRSPVGLRFDPMRCGTSSTVVPMRSTITKFEKSPYTSA